MKLQKISEIQPTLPLTEFDFMKKYREGFRQSELGHIYELLPLKEIAAAIAKIFFTQRREGRGGDFPFRALEGACH